MKIDLRKVRKDGSLIFMPYKLYEKLFELGILDEKGVYFLMDETVIATNYNQNLMKARLNGEMTDMMTTDERKSFEEWRIAPGTDAEKMESLYLKYCRAKDQVEYYSRHYNAAMDLLEEIKLAQEKRGG
jgi:hypothetical protein